MNSKAHTLLLEAPSLIGFIGSADTDGMPRTVPVWYRWDGKLIHITTASSSVWVNNLINDSRSSFCVAEHGPPYQAVVMQGRVQVDNKDEAEVRRIFCAIWMRSKPKTITQRLNMNYVWSNLNPTG